MQSISNEKGIFGCGVAGRDPHASSCSAEKKGKGEHGTQPPSSLRTMRPDLKERLRPLNENLLLKSGSVLPFTLNFGDVILFADVN